MKEKSKISVIIPCYNNQDTIEETLQSVIKQTYKNVEIIVVNDGSTDESIRVVETFIAQNSSFDIKLVNQQNQGPSFARNNGAQLSNGEFLVFVDADDLVAAEYFSKGINLLAHNSNLSIVYCEAEFFEAKTGKWKLPKFKRNDFLLQNSIPIFAIIRNESFRSVGGFDENLHFTEDWDLWIRIIKKYGDGVFQIPEVLFYYRKRYTKNSLTDNALVDNISDKSLLYIYNKHYDFYHQNGLSITNLLKSNQYKHKYYNVWYRKLFYSFKNRKNERK